MEINILENPDLKNMSENFFGKVNPESQILYLLILFILLLAGIFMAIIKIPVYMESKGIIRPLSEKKTICSPVDGIVMKIFVEENQKINKDDLILCIEANKEKAQLGFLNQELLKITEWIQDCVYMTSNEKVVPDSIHTQKYRSEFLAFTQESHVMNMEIKVIEREVKRLKPLEMDSLISQKEMETMELKLANLTWTNESAGINRRKQWLEQLDNYFQKQIILLKDIYSLEQYIRNAEVRSPVSGYVQGIRNIFTADFCHAGKQICLVVPDTTLIAELFIPSWKIGYIEPGIKTRFKFDAFDYNYWGCLEGQCISVSKDFEIIENLPCFRVICKVTDPGILSYKNKSVTLHPGLTLTTQFVFSTRTIWQLIRDKTINFLVE